MSDILLLKIYLLEVGSLKKFKAIYLPECEKFIINRKELTVNRALDGTYPG